MKPKDNFYKKIIKKGDISYRLFWNKDNSYFTLECDDEYDDVVVIYNGFINDLISELEILKSLIDENQEMDKRGNKPK